MVVLIHGHERCQYKGCRRIAKVLIFFRAIRGYDRTKRVCMPHAREIFGYLPEDKDDDFMDIDACPNCGVLLEGEFWEGDRNASGLDTSRGSMSVQGVS